MHGKRTPPGGLTFRAYRGLPMLEPGKLDDEDVRDLVVQSMQWNYYVVEDWSPEFYVELAHLGFIAVTFDNMLLPELQRAYCVLDWKNLHICKRVIKELRKSTRGAGRFRLTFDTDMDTVFECLDKYRDDGNWLNARYQAMLRSIQGRQMPVKGTEFCIHSVEVWRDTEDGSGEVTSELIAGEMGYTIGSTYTSLTGFKTPGPCYGTLQLVALALVAKQCGIKFWNLGHPFREAPECMMYKKELGGHIVSRAQFKERWDAAVSVPSAPLQGSFDSDDVLALIVAQVEMQRTPVPP
eukprot:GEMP01022046.1.p1 GENE.GEMP01022046.1~~GEMP01022046.1.p1  ORF type:complete len:295 (+),score=59.19 GEMP01022046.1:76-960(+)